MPILLVFGAEKPTFPQNTSSFLQSDWTRWAGLLRRGPPLATKYQHYGDREHILFYCSRLYFRGLTTRLL